MEQTTDWRVVGLGVNCFGEARVIGTPRDVAAVDAFCLRYRHREKPRMLFRRISPSRNVEVIRQNSCGHISSRETEVLKSNG